METLAVVEVLGRNGEVLRRERLSSLPASIGRGFEADLMIDDPYIAACHLRLNADEGNGFILTDLGSINGFSIPTHNNHRQGTPVHVKAGETIRFGHTQIRVWRADSPVDPEIVDMSTTETRGWITFGAWLLIAPGLMAMLTWVGATGPSRYGAVSLEFLSWIAAVLIWSGLWWVASRSSHHITTYVAHGAIGASTLVLVILSLFTLDTVFYAFDLYPSRHGIFTGIVLGTCLASGIYRHLRLVSRKSRQMLTSVSFAVAVALIVPLYYALKQNDLDKIGLMDIPSQLRLPWMRIANGVSPEEFFN